MTIKMLHFDLLTANLYFSYYAQLRHLCTQCPVSEMIECNSETLRKKFNRIMLNLDPEELFDFRL